MFGKALGKTWGGACMVTPPMSIAWPCPASWSGKLVRVSVSIHFVSYVAIGQALGGQRSKRIKQNSFATCTAVACLTLTFELKDSFD